MREGRREGEERGKGDGHDGVEPFVVGYLTDVVELLQCRLCFRKRRAVNLTKTYALAACLERNSPSRNSSSWSNSRSRTTRTITRISTLLTKE